MGTAAVAAGPTAQNGRVREPVTSARRIVVKIGSSSLTTASGGLDDARVDALVDTLAALATAGREVVLVSSGAIAAGLAPLGLTRRPRDLATQQAAASVGQGLLIGRYAAGFARHDLTVGQVLLTVDDVTRRAHYRNAYRTLRKLLDLRAVPIVNENDTVATEEIRFGDNDRLAALVAALVHAELLVLLSDVDALWTGDPSRPESTRITEVRDERDLAGVQVGGAGRAGVGTGGMVTKVEAARIATGFGIPVVLTAAPLAAGALAGEEVGTLFHAGRRRPTARLFWLAHATTPRGRLHLDEERSRPWWAGASRCCPPGSPPSTERSPRATRSTWSTPGAHRSPGDWSTTTPSSCPACSAGPPANSPRPSARRTNVRSSTATTWYCCRQGPFPHTVRST